MSSISICKLLAARGHHDQIVRLQHDDTHHHHHHHACQPVGGGVDQSWKAAVDYAVTCQRLFNCLWSFLSEYFADSWHYKFNWLSQYPAFLSSVVSGSEWEPGRSTVKRDPTMFSDPVGVKASREKSMKKVCVGGCGGRAREESSLISHQLSTHGGQTRK